MKRKTKLILGLAVCLLALFTIHGVLLWRFGKQPPRLEILNPLPRQALDRLAPYHPQNQQGIWAIEGEGLFWQQEVSDILAGAGVEGILLNDRTQAWKLARQSGTLTLFCFSLMGLALLARWLVRDMRQATFWWKQRLEEAYPKGIFAIWGEKILSRCLRWALALLAMGLLALWVAGCRFQVPSQLTPPDYILNLSFYRNLNLTQVSDSAYEQLCRRVLPACYGLTAAETALGLALAILQAGKGRERGGKEWPM